MSYNIKRAASLKDEGNVLVAQKLYAKAAEKYKEAIELDPNVAAYHSNLSHCYKCLEKYKEAELSARRVVRLNPEKKSLLVKGYWRLAQALLAQNEGHEDSSDGQNYEFRKHKLLEDRFREAAEVLRLAKMIDPTGVTKDLNKTEAECQKLGIRANSDGSWYDFDREFETEDEYSDSDEDEVSYDIHSDDESKDDSDAPPEMMSSRNDNDSDSEPPPLDDRPDSESSSDESMPPLHDRNESDSSSGSDSDSDDDIPGLSNPRGDSSDSDSDDSYSEKRIRVKRLREQERKKREEAERARQQRIKEQLEEERRKTQEAAEKKRKEAEKKRKAAEKKRKKKEEKQLKALKEKNGSKISTFLASYYRRDVALRRAAIMMTGFEAFQWLVRGHLVRVKTRDALARRLAFAKKYKEHWQGCIQSLDGVSTQLSNWTAIRSEQRFIKRADYDYDDEFTETNKLLEDALNQAMEESGQDQDQDLNLEAEETSLSDNEDDHNIDDDGDKTSPNAPSTPSFGEHTKIRFTSDAVKWIKQGDAKYVGFFIKKMERLSRGDRSHKLAKALVGPKNKVIYETYLENKSGQRILWTEEGGNILVWYIAKHKSVSRLANLIDDSDSRSTRQRTDLEELESLAPGMIENSKTDSVITPFDERPVVLDPLGNVPLKVYEIPAHDLENVAEDTWMPPMHLTEEEKKVVETDGTVLLLGRSGTGKTVCICNRMEYDRQSQRVKRTESFSQLFVARSRRLCTFVANTIGNSSETAFSTFEELLRMLNDELPEIRGVRSNFLPRQRMDFAKFKRDVYHGDNGLDPLLVWTNIRSFIKGSIDAVKSLPSSAVSREEYISSEVFKKVSRVKPDEMESVYDIYKRYETYIQDHDLWDNCDRMMALLQRLVFAMENHPEVYYGLRKTKIYVDEIQDYTQAEILMFFHLSAGLSDLFLAGDPAQSVAEGIEFRFEDIRSVAYYLVGGNPSEKAKNIPGIPNKPKTVNVNFRSHAGVLNTAGDILSLMFGAFPESATELKEDKGLFSGPRPGVYDRVPADRLSTLVSEKLNGIVILTHDEKVESWRERLDGYPLVYGIRAAKGLEFKRVILLDFFSDLPKDMLKPWRELILGRAEDDFKVKYPEIEGHLKLLYTAVTRCIEQLFFAETESTMAGDAFIRWITTNTVKNGVKPRNVSLATRNNISDIEKMTLTRDEWLASGIENAEFAESDVGNDLEKAIQLLERAKYCFQEAKEKDNELFRKAHAHLESIKFISQLPPLVSEKDDENANFDEAIEIRGAQIAKSLLSQGLLTATEDLCTNISPYISTYSRQRLEKEFIPQLSNKNA